MRVSNGGSASRAGAACTPLDVGPALRGALVPLNAPLVPGGAVHVSCEGRFLVVAQNAVHIFTPTVSFHPLLNPEHDAVFHTQIPREAASLDDWKDRPFYLDRMCPIGYCLSKTADQTRQRCLCQAILSGRARGSMRAGRLI